jgi:hypothetical protein
VATYGTGLAKERRAFEKAMFAALKPLLKGSAWKVAAGFVFARIGDDFVEAFTAVFANAERTTVELKFKPMALDPIFWDIFDLPDNHREPLSFRARGCFTCTGVPIAEMELELAGDDPAAVAGRLAAFCLEAAPLIVRAQAAHRFSDQVRDHPNQRERGAYAVTHVIALIAEGDYDAAREHAQAYACGARPSGGGFTYAGRDFHEIALDWLAARARGRTRC